MTTRSGGPRRAARHGTLFGILMVAAGVSAAAGAATRYASDPANGSLEFSFVQAGAQNKGSFRKFSVALDFAPGNLAGSRLAVAVDVDSLDTGDRERDDTLRGPDLFDAAKFRQARFVATRLTKTGSGYDAVGTLTLRGVSREVHVPFTFRTAVEQGREVAYLAGRTVIRRLDFGVGQGDWKSTEWVGNDVGVAYSVRLAAAAH